MTINDNSEFALFNITKFTYILCNCICLYCLNVSNYESIVLHINCLFVLTSKCHFSLLLYSGPVNPNLQ